MRQKESENIPNVMEMIPAHSIEFEEMGGLIILLEPKVKNRVLVKHVLPRLKNKYYKIHLDEFGTWVWKQMNGQKSVYEIGNELAVKFGERGEPVYERLGLFINMMAQRKFITISNP